VSGHSKWSTIKRAKEANDKAKGKTFSKLSRAISIAVKSGGGPDIDSNYRLRVAVDVARASNMPKDNIERAISKAGGEGLNIEEVVYEGFGPKGIGVIVEAATDNRNRTAQEIKGLIERHGGTFASPGAVAFNFENKGFLLIEKGPDLEAQMLSLIDLGVEDIEETEDGIEIHTNSSDLSATSKKISEAGWRIIRTELTRRPITSVTVTDPEEAKKIIAFLELLEEHDDVQRVFTNVDISENALK
jgi:YebC/PmpR family DNA-binding regulatory protein